MFESCLSGTQDSVFPTPAFPSRVFLFDLLAPGLLIWLKNRLAGGGGRGRREVQYVE